MAEPALEPIEVLTLVLVVAIAPCGHPAARRYVNAVSGKGDCLDCRRDRRAERARRGEVRSRSARKTVQEPRPHGRTLSPDELAYLRRQVACVGCGAVRQDRTGAKIKGPPYTKIRHGKGCPVRAGELAELRLHNRQRGAASAAARLKASPDGDAA